MSDTINIRRRGTVNFRTDCFASGYDVDYFVRSNHGYYPLITDVSDGQNTYDVGYNPYAEIVQVEPYNPFVCDELFLDWHGWYSEIQSISDVPYQDVKFTVPIIAIPNSALSSSADKDHIILANDEYYLIDNLSIDAQTMTSHITGTKHENGQDIPYNGALEQLVSFDPPIRNYRLAFAPRRPYGELTVYRFCNVIQLQNIFSGTSAECSIWDVIGSYGSGAFVLTGDRTADDHHIQPFRYFALDEYDMLEELYADAQTDGFLNYVIPFANPDEYFAARCSYYRWRTADIQAIQNWLNNR